MTGTSPAPDHSVTTDPDRGGRRPSRQSVCALWQIALSTADLPRSHTWYRRALGFLPTGATRHLDSAGPAPVPGLPECTLDLRFVVDRQEWFQLEIVEFARPRVRPLPADWRLSDVGYGMIGIHVADFDEAIERIRRTSGRPLTAPLAASTGRRVCLRDPDGILLELMEDDPRAPVVRPRIHDRAPAAVRCVTVSVSCLDRARRFWIDGMGLDEASGITLHGPEHESLWDLAGSRRESLLLWAGDILVELVRYFTPRPRWRPAGYLLSDQGILNLAFGTTEEDVFHGLLDRLLSLGYSANSAPWTKDKMATVVYVNDDQGFSVELLRVEPSARAYMGFVPNLRTAEAPHDRSTTPSEASSSTTARALTSNATSPPWMTSSGRSGGS